LTNSVVGTGFTEFGDLSNAHSLDDIRQRIEERHPAAKPSTVTNRVGQVDAFVNRTRSLLRDYGL
jgi:predicted Mrr-cat superfamily restriction endonuclease